MINRLDILDQALRTNDIARQGTPVLPRRDTIQGVLLCVARKAQRCHPLNLSSPCNHGVIMIEVSKCNMCVTLWQAYHACKQCAAAASGCHGQGHAWPSYIYMMMANADKFFSAYSRRSWLPNNAQFVNEYIYRQARMPCRTTSHRQSWHLASSIIDIFESCSPSFTCTTSWQHCTTSLSLTPASSHSTKLRSRPVRSGERLCARRYSRLWNLLRWRWPPSHSTCMEDDTQVLASLLRSSSES